METPFETLKNKKIIIIGGSTGIGLETAKAAAARGAEIIIASSSPAKIENALHSLPSNARGIAVDCSNEQQIKSLFEQAGRFDHLVYTAGENLQLSTLAETNVADARQFFNIRYWGALMAVKYATPYISRQGSIVLTGGIAGARPGKGWSLGASICSAMEGFTRAMAVELAPTRVNLVSPGVVRTGLWSNMSAQEQEQLFESVARTIPVGKVATPADIAKTYVYLMEQEIATGQSLIVDGGTVLV